MPQYTRKEGKHEPHRRSGKYNALMTANRFTLRSYVAAKGRGALVDRTTQRWVALDECPWLHGPVGDVDVIGIDFFTRLADREGLAVVADGPPRGLVRNFRDLAGPACDPLRVDGRVVEFYERTSEYEFDVWSEWRGGFRPFGNALAAIFSRRLQQLNVPLSPLDTSRGISTSVVQLVDDAGAQ